MQSLDRALVALFSDLSRPRVCCGTTIRSTHNGGLERFGGVLPDGFRRGSAGPRDAVPGAGALHSKSISGADEKIRGSGSSRLPGSIDLNVDFLRYDGLFVGGDRDSRYR